MVSLPSRGAWIEMRITEGEWWMQRCRSPHGERGLKLMDPNTLACPEQSLPSRGAWIEITSGNTILFLFDVAPLTGSVD